MHTIPTQAYPLAWPPGRPRTAEPEVTYAFRSQRTRARHSLNDGASRIYEELRKMGAEDAVISSNLRIKPNGLPYSDQGRLQDQGVAVYFRHRGKPVCFACDKWSTIEDNLWAIFLTLEALRGVERWGAANLEATFTGYAALPAPASAESWWDVLHVARDASPAAVTHAYRQRCLETHPDSGGSHEAFVRVRAAYDAYLKENPDHA